MNVTGMMAFVGFLVFLFLCLYVVVVDKNKSEHNKFIDNDFVPYDYEQKEISKKKG